MDPLPGMRCKNTVAAPAKDGTVGLSALLPEMQAGVHHQRTEFQNRDYQSARRKDAALTAISSVMHCVFF